MSAGADHPARPTRRPERPDDAAFCRTLFGETFGDTFAALDEALRRFVAARGPIPADDAAWWTGLPKTLVRASLARARDLGTVLVAGEPMLVAAEAATGRRTGVRLVPGFDDDEVVDALLVKGPCGHDACYASAEYEDPGVLVFGGECGLSCREGGERDSAPERLKCE